MKIGFFERLLFRGWVNDTKRRIRIMRQNVYILEEKNKKLMKNPKINPKTKLKMIDRNRIKMNKYRARATELTKIIYN